MKEEILLGRSTDAIAPLIINPQRMKHRNLFLLAIVLASSVGLARLGITHAQTASVASTATTVADPVDTAIPEAMTTATSPTPQMDPAVGGHIGANGVREELLTGDTAAKATAAALTAVPGGTIQRVENDAEGATYEAHMSKSDGTHVTVKMDASFKVTSVDSGPR